MSRSTGSTRTLGGRSLPRPTEAGRFLTTRWSLVLHAGRGDDPGAQEALARLCRAYWFPLYAFLRRWGQSPHDAQDLTQGFFGYLLQGEKLAKAAPEKGRFRSFLLTSLKHFVAHEWEKARAQKRGGNVHFVPLSPEAAETHYCAESVAQESPERAFDRQWALSVLDLVLSRLRAEYSSGRREMVFEALKETLSAAEAGPRYRHIAARLGVTESAIKMAAQRLRARYREILREEITRTVDDPDDVDAELRHLFAALGP